MINLYNTIVKTLLVLWLAIIVISFGMGNTIIIQEPDIVDALNTITQDTTIEKWIDIREKNVFSISEKKITISWNFTVIPDSSAIFTRLKRKITEYE